jgi:arabinofuranosyltransferase
MLVKNKTVLFLFLGITAIFLIHALYLSTIAEDAFISFRFAKNLAAGNGLLWNVGDPPVEGYTNFLWILISAGTLYAGFNLLIFSQITGIIVSIILLIYVYLFCRRILEFDKYVSFLPVLFLAFSGPLATWATSGMETNLFTLLVFGSFYYLVSYWKFQKNKLLIFSLLLNMLATLTRPEGFGIFLILTAFHLYNLYKLKNRKGLQTGVVFALLFYIVPILIYFVWRLSYFGYLLPLTFYAKTGGTFYQWFRGLRYIFFFSFHYLAPLVPIIFVFLFIKSDRIRFLDFVKPGKKKNDNIFLSIQLIFIISFLYTFYIIFVGGDYMAMYRFFVPILPFIYLLVASLLNSILKSFVVTKKQKFIFTVLILFALGGTIVQSTPLERFLFTKPSNTHGQYQGVLTERWHTNRLTLLGKFFNDYKKSEEESLATGAIGAISYYSNMKIYGLHGLVDPFIAKKEMKNIGKGFPGHEKSDLLHILSKHPNYFMFSRELTEEPLSYPKYSKEVNEVLQSKYRIVTKWLKDIENNEEGYFTFLERIN